MKFTPPTIPTSLQEIADPLLASAGVRLWLKRDDLTGSHLMGNKARKLKYNLMAMREQGLHKLVTFGGAYSNHIYATAAAGKIYELQTFGFIRGEEPRGLNPVLQFASTCGMELITLDRDSYRRKREKDVLQKVRDHCGPDCFILPEGGSNELAVKGSAEILGEINAELKDGCDVIACAAGTGATLAGIINTLNPAQRAIGFSALKNGDFLVADIQRWLNADAHAAWSICSDYACGGYAKTTPELLSFMDDFTARTGAPLDPVYTGKMMLGLYRMIAHAAFARGTKIVALHSGGYWPTL